MPLTLDCPLCAGPRLPPSPRHLCTVPPPPRARASARSPLRPGRPRRFQAAWRVPAPAVRPRPRRAPRARPGSGSPAPQPGREAPLEPPEPPEPQPQPERRAGRDSPRCLAPGNAAPAQGLQYPARRWGREGCPGRRELASHPEPSNFLSPSRGGPAKAVLFLLFSQGSTAELLRRRDCPTDLLSSGGGLHYSKSHFSNPKTEAMRAQERELCRCERRVSPGPQPSCLSHLLESGSHRHTRPARESWSGA